MRQKSEWKCGQEIQKHCFQRFGETFRQKGIKNKIK